VIHARIPYRRRTPRGQRIVGFVAAAFLLFGAVTDNAAVCPGESGPGSSAPAPKHDGGPAPAHACPQSPCQTPTVLQPSRLFESPADHASALFDDAVAAPLEAELPAPPTPPPTALV
jgi:hypothetical protein